MQLNNGNFLLVNCITIVCTAASIVYWNDSAQLGFDSSEFVPWQLITTHFAHYDIQHLASNLLALGLFMYIFPSPMVSIIKGFVVAMALIDAYLLLSGVAFYMGFSGLLYVVPGIAMGEMLKKKRYMGLCCLFVGFYIYMFHLSDAVHDSQGVIWQSLWQGHLLGLLAGFFVAVLNTGNSISNNKCTKPPIRTN
ncbi:MAG: rhomboid family intramembrane serine protease [Proteobacteria bacterium]|nr:rhomboid family intramembrane serine protease [Pseudomonadota bacterium]